MQSEPYNVLSNIAVPMQSIHAVHVQISVEDN